MWQPRGLLPSDGSSACTWCHAGPRRDSSRASMLDAGSGELADNLPAMNIARSAAPLLLLAALGGAFAQQPVGYPADYGAIVPAARNEGTVVVYSTTDLSAVAALIRDFETLYPGVKVDYEHL